MNKSGKIYISIIIMLLVISIIGVFLLFTGIVKASETETEIPAETQTETVAGIPAVYVICDVIKNYDEIVDGELYHTLEVIMPNGEIHKYGIQDPPEGNIDIVCFKTENQDDYSVYEVVAASSLTGSHIDMNDVIGYYATETGILLELSDGTGYYLEVGNGK